jgi:hypothetical protein
LVLASKDFDSASLLLQEGLAQHTLDDWAGYLLLMACKLPGTAIPFDDAAQGLFELEAGFAGLSDLLKTEEFWAEAKEACTPTGQRQAVAELEAFLQSAISQVPLLAHACTHIHCLRIHCMHVLVHAEVPGLECAWNIWYYLWAGAP